MEEKDIDMMIPITPADENLEEVPAKKKFNLWKFLLKIGFTALAFFLIYRKIDFVKLGETLGQANYFILFLAIVVYQLSQIASALRLNVVLRESNIHLDEKKNMKLYYIGMFYNLFLPGGVGGDGYKVALFKKYMKIPIKTSVRTVLYDRFSGLSALLFLITIPGILLLKEYTWVPWLMMPMVWIGFYFFTRIFFKSFRKITWKVCIYSFVIQSIQLACAWLILYSIGVSENQLAFLLVFMISSIVSILPIFLGGAGARELTFIYIFELMAMDAQMEPAIALSLLFFAISAINALPGIFVNERKLFLGK